MTSVLKKALDLLIGSDLPDSRSVILPKVDVTRPLKRLSERQLIQLESEIGAEIFGVVPQNHRREFFNLDPSTWIWYDEWMDEQNHKKSVTIRYEIHENGILKVREGARYDFIEDAELQNFVAAVNMYYERVCREVYGRNPLHGISNPALKRAV